MEDDDDGGIIGKRNELTINTAFQEEAHSETSILNVEEWVKKNLTERCG